MNNPVKQHYIPRFILRPFCHGNDQLYYYDKKTGAITVKNISEVFMVRDLYTEPQDYTGDQYHIERALAGFENDASGVIKRMLETDDILITFEEDDMLKLFLAVMSLRAERVKKKLYSERWQENLSEIVKCRSLREVMNNPRIDTLYKGFIRRDTEGIAGRFFSVVSKRGAEDFVIGDSYPMESMGVLTKNIKIPMYSIFPISNQRVLLHVANGIAAAPRNVMELPYSIFNKPHIQQDRKTIRIHVSNIYENDVKLISRRILEASSVGIVLKDRKNVTVICGC